MNKSIVQKYVENPKKRGNEKLMKELPIGKELKKNSKSLSRSAEKPTTVRTCLNRF